MAGRELRRGDVRWYRFPSPDKRRPVLVLGRDSLLRSVSDLPVIPFSTQIRGLPWEVVLRPDEGLGVASTLKPEWIRSLTATADGVARKTAPLPESDLHACAEARRCDWSGSFLTPSTTR
jgi:mRNA-degrading endonuclease toxin of MazEF toxin-antitoxin module